MKKTKRIGVLTSGGDSQGMNACLKTITMTAEKYNYQVIAFLGGYQGLLDDNFKVITSKEAAPYFHLGGSFIKSGRSKDFEDDEKRKAAKKVYKNHELEALIVLGGDGSIRGAFDLQKMGLNVVVIPCTIDNDAFCTERAIGFDTAVNNAVNAIDSIQQTMSANDRILLVEVMGRYCGDVALYSGLGSESDIIMIPEKKQKEEKIIREIAKQLNAGNKSPTVVIAEHQLNVQKLATKIETELSWECRAVVLGYIQRGGAPTMQDRLLAIRMGVASIECIINKTFGVVVSLNDDKINFKSFEEAIKAGKQFKEELWNTFLEMKRFKTIKKKSLQKK